MWLRPLALTLAAAVVGVLAVPPFGLTPLALLGPVLLLAGLRGQRPAWAALLGLVYGLVLYGVALSWLVEIFGPLAVALHVIVALFTAVFGLGVAWVERRAWSPGVRAVALAVLWTGVEHFRGEWFVLRFPWITPGTALPPGALTPLVGTYGVTFALLLAAALLTRPAASRAAGHRMAGGAVLAVVIAAVYTPRATRPIVDPIRVAAVQGEVLPFDAYMQLSEGITGRVDAIVWPEYALDFDLRLDGQRLEQTRRLLARTGAQVFVVGSRTDHADGTWSNTALTVGRAGLLGVHHKNRPVHFFNDGEPGTEAPAITTPLGPIATPICFDNDYAPVPREAVARGAELLLVPSMDAEHWTARQHHQHAELFRHRAAENGRWVVVSATSGVTQIVDPDGVRRAALPLFEPAVLVGEVERESGLTIYTRWGWLLGPVTTGLAGVLLLWLLVAEVRRAR